jgi:hypothetical protein
LKSQLERFVVLAGQKPCPYVVTEASDQHKVACTFLSDIYKVFAIIHLMWISEECESIITLLLSRLLAYIFESQLKS